mmetsp:Transcript_19836/g.58577  ORF Transcript_19836/g.58577 Transcript_19836/m.58577 type:complete len:97 (-) Transcript_19836:782-1072(-)
MCQPLKPTQEQNARVQVPSMVHAGGHDDLGSSKLALSVKHTPRSTPSKQGTMQLAKPRLRDDGSDGETLAAAAAAYASDAAASAAAAASASRTRAK